MSSLDDSHCEYERSDDDHKPCSESIYREHSGRKYCVLHYPDSSKDEGFFEAFQARLDEDNGHYLDFAGVWFPTEFSFTNYSFNRSANFSNAVFNSDVTFNLCEFRDVEFTGAVFVGYVDFEKATFHGETSFSSAHFQQGSCFALTTFVNGASFLQTKFSGQADFTGVDFKSAASFTLARFDSLADFSAARIFDDDNVNAAKQPFNWQRSRFGEAHFTATFFTQCSFRLACFKKTADFRRTVVQDAVDLSVIDFNEADFSDGVFARANFDGTYFLKMPNFNKTQFLYQVAFTTVRFPGADFRDSVFSGSVDFSGARFEHSVSKYEIDRLKECHEIGEEPTAAPNTVRLSFDRTVFRDSVIFKHNDFFQDQSILTFDDAVFEKPERVRFQSVSMPPHAFLNIDSRKFQFADVRWGFIDRRTALKEAKAAMAKHERLFSDALLELAYRQLAVNAEENNRYEEAANLRFLAMEVARSRRWRRVDWLRLSWWYWLMSGYGEKVRRAFAGLLIIWLAFALTYWSWGDSSWWQLKQTKSPDVMQSIVSVPVELSFSEALLYSANVMALQKPEPLPANRRAKLLVLGETILGPLQAALLALAIRRKFVR